MKRSPIIKYVKQLKGPFYTARDLARISGKAHSAVTQGMNNLCALGAVVKICRGIWADPNEDRLSPFSLIPFLMPAQRAYLSFLSALHLHGMVGQIPHVITLASTAHTHTINTSIGTFEVHRIEPAFFFGFDWYGKTGDFLIAGPEKALLDCFYIAGRKGKRFGAFPEIRFPESFNAETASKRAAEIRDRRLRAFVQKKLAEYSV